MKPIKAFGPPVLDAMGPIPYSQQNGLLDASLPKGALNYWKSQFLTDLSDDCISDAGRRLPGVPVADEPDRHRALPRRGQPRPRGRHGLHDAHHRLQRGDRRRSGRTGRDNDKCIAWCREMYASLRPYLGTHALRELPRHDEAGDPPRSPTGRTTRGCAISRPSTTRRTCSTSTSTSARADATPPVSP